MVVAGPPDGDDEWAAEAAAAWAAFEKAGGKMFDDEVDMPEDSLSTSISNSSGSRSNSDGSADVAEPAAGTSWEPHWHKQPHLHHEQQQASQLTGVNLSSLTHFSQDGCCSFTAKFTTIVQHASSCPMLSVALSIYPLLVSNQLCCLVLFVMLLVLV